jgi:hypothetical protein
LLAGYAFRAHEILHRLSRDLDFATRDDLPLPEIAADVRHAFTKEKTMTHKVMLLPAGFALIG